MFAQMLSGLSVPALSSPQKNSRPAPRYTFFALAGFPSLSLFFSLSLLFFFHYLLMFFLTLMLLYRATPKNTESNRLTHIQTERTNQPHTLLQTCRGHIKHTLSTQVSGLAILE
jgi:hypothetical protein